MSGPKIERSQGKPRMRAPRRPRGSTPDPCLAALTAPLRDPQTGKFLPGNDYSRARTLKEHASALVGLNPATCIEWLKPFAELASTHAVQLAEEHGALSSKALSGLCEDVASAKAVYRGLLALAAKTGDVKHLQEARAWLSEVRQNVTLLRHEARSEAQRKQGAVSTVAAMRNKVAAAVAADAAKKDGAA